MSGAGWRSVSGCNLSRPHTDLDRCLQGRPADLTAGRVSGSVQVLETLKNQGPKKKRKRRDKEFLHCPRTLTSIAGPFPSSIRQFPASSNHCLATACSPHLAPPPATPNKCGGRGREAMSGVILCLIHCSGLLADCRTQRGSLGFMADLASWRWTLNIPSRLTSARHGRCRCLWFTDRSGAGSGPGAPRAIPGPGAAPLIAWFTGKQGPRHKEKTMFTSLLVLAHAGPYSLNSR